MPAQESMAPGDGLRVPFRSMSRIRATKSDGIVELMRSAISFAASEALPGRSRTGPHCQASR